MKTGCIFYLEILTKTKYVCTCPDISKLNM
jgi:hypothetical protein